MKSAFQSLPAVVTIVGHWDHSDQVELHDGLHPWQAIARICPDDFSGIIDLCVCHPEPLVRHLKSTQCGLVRHKVGGPSNPVVWLGLYLVIATLIKDGGAAFDEAMCDAVSRIRST